VFTASVPTRLAGRSQYNLNGDFSAVNGGGNTLNFNTGNVTMGASMERARRLFQHRLPSHGRWPQKCRQVSRIEAQGQMPGVAGWTAAVPGHFPVPVLVPVTLPLAS